MPKTKIFPHLAVVLCAMSMLALPQRSFGQAAAINGQIEGTVTDPSGASGAGAQVEVLNEETGFKRSATADESGFFRLAVLPLGTYSLTVNASGFAPEKRGGIRLNAGATVTINIVLALAGQAREITVSSAAPVVEIGRTDIGSSLSGNQIGNLPLVSRNNFNYILVQPNVSGHPNTEFGVPRKVNANGFTDRINYQLDGSNNTQNDRAGIRLMPISNTWVQEVQQVNNGFAPEFGNTAGTVFNSVTKSGANDLHGEAAYIFRRTDFGARQTTLKPTDAKPITNVGDFFADAGGRVVKDKFFWFGSFERVTRDLPQPVTVTAGAIASLGLPASYASPIPFRQTVYFVMGRADYQINQANRLFFRFNWFRNESPYNAGTFTQTLITQTYLFKDRAPSYAAQLISTVSPQAVNELRFQLPKRYQRQLAFEGTGPQPVLFVSGVANFGGSDQTGFVFTEKTPEVSDNFSVNRGTHAIKFGVDLRFIRDQQVSPTFARYTFATIDAYLAAVKGTSPKGYTNYTQTFGSPEFDYNSLFTGIYAQDNWKIRPNLTLIYGARWDVFRGPKANAQSILPTSQNWRTRKTNLAPRVGLAWSPGKDQKTVIRVNGGMFYDAPQINTYFRALQGNGLPQFFNLSTVPTAAFAPAFPNIFTALPTGFSLPVQDVTTISKDFRNLYSINLNTQISREITSNFSVTAGYLYTKGTHIPVYRNVNLVPGALKLADGRPIFGTARVFSGLNNIMMAESVGNSNYNGFNLALNRRYARGYEFMLSYTWSHALDAAPEQNNLDSTSFLSDPTNRARDYGNGLSDRRNVLIANGVLRPEVKTGSRGLDYLLNHNELSTIITAQSGDIFNMGSNLVLNGDASTSSTFQRPLYVARNTIRGPAIYEFNMRYTRAFPVREGKRVEFFGEFTNLFNHSNFTGLNTTASVDTAGNILTPASLARTASLDPRLMQLGFRFTF
jgi:hypothetical protein